MAKGVRQYQRGGQVQIVIHTPQSERQYSLLNTMREVDSIVGKLEEIHSFTTNYKFLGSHASHKINKHDSLDDAPISLFRGKERRDSVGVSPGKRISLRSEIQQLKKCGVIGNDQYHELQETILTDNYQDHQYSNCEISQVLVLEPHLMEQ